MSGPPTPSVLGGAVTSPTITCPASLESARGHQERLAWERPDLGQDEEWLERGRGCRWRAWRAAGASRTGCPEASMPSRPCRGRARRRRPQAWCRYARQEGGGNPPADRGEAQADAGAAALVAGHIAAEVGASDRGGMIVVGRHGRGRDRCRSLGIDRKAL